MKRNIQKALAGTAAIVAALYGMTALRSVLHGAWFLADSGSGGIGAVSLGLFEALLPLAAGAAVNRVLVRWARRAGGVILILHRTHTMMLLLLTVLVALTVIVFAAGFRLGFELLDWLTFGMITGFTFAAQSLLLAVTLFVFATKEPDSTA
jgi:hypothetical protein